METTTVRIFGWRIGARTMAAVAELRTATALGQLGAKNVIYDVIGGVSVDVAPLPGIDPEEFAARLKECGFVVSLQAPIFQNAAVDDVSELPDAWREAHAQDSAA